jgi:SAM-dependent MidA family methyltransferase
VALGRDGGFTEVLSAPLHPLPSWLPTTASLGARVPIQEQAAEWVDDVRSRLVEGRIVAIDYAVGRTGELAMREWRGWLRTYRNHERGAHYLVDAGMQDITADVCLDQLPPPDAVRSQAQFLKLHGIDDLVEEGRREWAQAAAAPTVRAMTMRSRVREAEALLDPSGLGGFLAVEWNVA